MSENNIRVIAFYLPQYYPIPENDEWWGKGFTEWRNVAKAQKIFKGHYQPRIAADLGYYDLRVPETRIAQAEMARKYGVEGFCYWHYWFGNGKRLLERPFNEVLASGKPDFPFCLAWANESWRGIYHGTGDRNILIEQLYPGEDDYRNHFQEVLPAFKDKRYIKVNNKPLFMLYRPLEFKEVTFFIELWQKLAKENGLEGIYFVANHYNTDEIDAIKKLGFDAVNVVRLKNYEYQQRKNNPFKFLMFRRWNRLTKGMRGAYSYKTVMKYLSGVEDEDPTTFPSIIPNWDHSPRSGNKTYLLHNSTPEYFGEHLTDVFERVKNKPEQQKIVFLKSWNEWAEGNYMEPDMKWGLQYLEMLKKKLDEYVKK